MPPSRPSKDRETKEARVLANRYEVLRKLGSGNFGTAFLCKDKKSNDEYKVLKEISVGDLQPDETVDAMHEARLLSKLDHPGIVRFHDSFIDGEFFCIITEYCESGDLDHKIGDFKKAGKTFDEKTVLNWIVQLLLAVQYMHSRRVLHRDLKTRNIFIRNNLMKIGDFGISRILMGTMDMASTFTGTPYYMSPEVLKHEGYNSKSDVWSIGCIMYELCSLEHAFSGQGLMAVMYKIVEKDPPDLPKKYSKELNDVFKIMLTKDPEKRPSASEVLKLPYVARHMAKMKETLTDEYKAKHNVNQETANREAQELAMLLREKSKLDDLRNTRERDQFEEEEMEDTEAKPRMTAREKLRLKKMEEADKKAKDLMKATKIQLVENAERREKIKSSIEQTTLPPWKGGLGEGRILKEAIEVRDPRIGTSPRDSHGAMHYGGYGSSDDEELTVKNSTVMRRHSDRGVGGSSSHTLGLRRMNQSLSNRTANTLSMTYAGQPDDRPITPMKDLMVYDREHSSLDFKDGIPDTPDLANTYYEQFEKDFDDDADIVMDNQADEDGEGTLVEEHANKDEEDFISCLERALDREDLESTTVNDDTIMGAYGPGARETKIKNLKGECIKMLGEEEFKKAYKYLRNARYAQEKKDRSEKDIMDGLAKFVKHPGDCFIVDQLLFLEEQAKLNS